MKIIIYFLIILSFISCKKYELEKGFEDSNYIGFWVPYYENNVGGMNLNHYTPLKVELKRNGKFLETSLSYETNSFGRSKEKIIKKKGIISLQDNFFIMEYGNNFKNNDIKELQIIRGPIIKDTVIISRHYQSNYYPIDDIRVYRGFIVFEKGIVWYLE